MTQSELSQIDLVARAHHRRKIDFRRGLKQGYLDQLVAYHKPPRPKWMSEEEYETYPSYILVRHLKYKVEQKGFRTREITLATTLLGASVYEADELASLYHRRWLVELHIGSLKTQTQLTVGDRPGRQEKRELKRRQKNYKLMQSPRNPNRNRYATAA